MKIEFQPGVLEYFNELTTLLYEEGYFGFRESAVRYVDTLLADIRANLPFKLKKSAPPYFDRFGKNLLYASFRKSKGTQWYVFFNVYERRGEAVFLIRYIGNNHVLAQYL